MNSGGHKEAITPIFPGHRKFSRLFSSVLPYLEVSLFLQAPIHTKYSVSTYPPPPWNPVVHEQQVVWGTQLRTIWHWIPSSLSISPIEDPLFASRFQVSISLIAFFCFNFIKGRSFFFTLCPAVVLFSFREEDFTSVDLHHSLRLTL